MSHTNSSPLDLVGTSLKAASLHHYLGAMADTNSSLSGLIVASLKAATLYLRAMGDTDPSLNDTVGTTFVAAKFPCPCS
jgi:hypothetical protein